MGETELVLDRLAVDEALRLIAGAASGTTEPASGERDTPLAPVGAESDWRAALRAAGASPDVPRPAKREAEPPRAIEPPIAPKASAPVPASHIALPAPQGLSVGTPAGELFGGSLARLESLDAIVKEVASCTKCPLYKTATNPVPGEGNPSAQLMCVGEAPGAT